MKREHWSMRGGPLDGAIQIPHSEDEHWCWQGDHQAIYHRVDEEQVFVFVGWRIWTKEMHERLASKVKGICDND